MRSSSIVRGLGQTDAAACESGKLYDFACREYVTILVRGCYSRKGIALRADKSVRVSWTISPAPELDVLEQDKFLKTEGRFLRCLHHGFQDDIRHGTANGRL